MKRILLLIGCVLLLGGCATKVDNNRLDRIIENNTYIIVDVRTKEEYDEGHLKDAINIPYDEIEENIFDKTKTILVYCKSGARSKKAYDSLTKMGYTAYDLGAYDKIDKFEKVK